MICYDIKRGVGKSAEIFGLSEKYLASLAKCLLLACIGFIAGRVFYSAFLGAILFFAVMVGAFFYFQRLSIQHGDYGVDKLKAYGKRPRIIKVTTRAVFLNLQK